jgi:hypothetical protein
MEMKTLHRRLEALEKSWAITNKARDEIVANVLYQISRENLELLIDAALASQRGRGLTEREASARQAYAAALQSECQSRGLAVRRMPDIPQLISQTVLRQESLDQLLLGLGGLRAMAAGFEPTTAQVAVLEAHRAAQEAQYQRAGFSSEAEFEKWYANRTSASVDGDRAGMGR